MQSAVHVLRNQLSSRWAHTFVHQACQWTRAFWSHGQDHPKESHPKYRIGIFFSDPSKHLLFVSIFGSSCWHFHTLALPWAQFRGKSDGLCVTIDWVCGSESNCEQMPFCMEFQQFEIVLTVMNCAAHFGGGGPNPVLDLDLASPYYDSLDTSCRSCDSL